MMIIFIHHLTFINWTSRLLSYKKQTLISTLWVQMGLGRRIEKLAGGDWRPHKGNLDHSLTLQRQLLTSQAKRKISLARFKSYRTTTSTSALISKAPPPLDIILDIWQS